MDQKTIIQDLQSRVAALERAVFTNKRTAKASRPAELDHSGCTGAVRFLLSKGFFGKKRPLREVVEESAKHDYHYSAQAFTMALTRLSGKSGPLVVVRESGKKLYVKRK
jgi:hypothetical protein